MQQNDHFIVMLSQMLLHVSAHQRRHRGAHTILTSHLYVGVRYRSNNGIWSEVGPISNFALWTCVDMLLFNFVNYLFLLRYIFLLLCML
jgi:hypothetical protein